MKVVDDGNSQESRGKDLRRFPTDRAEIDVQHVQGVSSKESGSAPNVCQVAKRVAASVMRWPNEPFDSFLLQLGDQLTTLRNNHDWSESIPVDAADKVQQSTTGSAPVLVSADEVTYPDAHDIAVVSMVADGEDEAVAEATRRR